MCHSCVPGIYRGGESVLSTPTSLGRTAPAFYHMPSPLPESIEGVLEEAESDYSSTTIQSYRAAWRDFLRWWTGRRDAEAWAVRLKEEGAFLPPFEAIAGYLEESQSLAWSTLTGRRQAIRLVFNHYKALDPFEQPEVRQAWAEIRRLKREEEPESSDDQGDSYGPATVIEDGLELLEERLSGREGREEMSKEELFRKGMQYLTMQVSSSENLDPDQQKLIPELAYDRKTMRNRALLLLVATTKATRTDITGIQVDDIHLQEKDAFVQGEAEKAKNAPIQIGLRDDEGDLESVLHLRKEPALRCCPARAVASWITRADLEEGQLFRSLTPQGKVKSSGIRPQAINHVIRRRAKEVEGLDPSEWTTRRLRSR